MILILALACCAKPPLPPSSPFSLHQRHESIIGHNFHLAANSVSAFKRIFCCSNEEFVQAVASQESDDEKTLEEKVGRSISADEQRRIGMSKLKEFLETLLLEKYISRLPQMMTTIQQQAQKVVGAGNMLMGEFP